MTDLSSQKNVLLLFVLYSSLHSFTLQKSILLNGNCFEHKISLDSNINGDFTFLYNIQSKHFDMSVLIYHTSFQHAYSVSLFIILNFNMLTVCPYLSYFIFETSTGIHISLKQAHIFTSTGIHMWTHMNSTHVIFAVFYYTFQLHTLGSHSDGLRTLLHSYFDVIVIV